MKIFEIVSTNYKNTNNGKDTPDYLIDPLAPNSGATGKVSNDDDPFMVNKEYYFPLKPGKKDGYKIYVDSIAKNNLSSKNPFLPRVYEVSLAKTPKGNDLPTFKMEKLQTLTSIDDSMLFGIANSLFNDATSLAYTAGLLDSNPDSGEITDHCLANMIKYVLKFHKFDEIKNSKFKEALLFINELAEENKLSLDLHANNFMIRPTSHGPQLVITDPFA